MSLIIPAIMCGGSGTRMWPESRECLPKQFIKLLGNRSSFQETLALFCDRSVFALPIVLSNVSYHSKILEQLEEIGAGAELALESLARGSGSAVCVAAELARRRDETAIVVAVAADHNVLDKPKLASLFAQAAEAASRGYIVTLGIPPRHPATSYGYIRPGVAVGGNVFRVSAFLEKPGEELARVYMAEGCLWNSGNFIFPAAVMLDEARRFEPEMAIAVARAVDLSAQDGSRRLLDEASFGAAPKKPIGCSTMKRTERAAVIAAEVGWSDLGAWSAVHELSPKDENGNSVRGRALLVESRNVLVRSEHHLTAVVGVEDVVVVSTPDAVLVARTDKTRQVKKLVERLQAEKRPEAGRHLHIERPWGYYRLIDFQERYKVNRVLVRPGRAPSLKRHRHRAEHWVVVRGTAELEIDGVRRFLHENQSAFVPIGAAHRIANPGRIDLELIEVQTGTYLSDDDAERLEHRPASPQ